MSGLRPTHDHTHVSPTAVTEPREHSHIVAPATPHLHGHEGHTRAVHRPAASVAISVDGVCAGYFGRDVLDEVSFDVAQGEFVGVIGPNGSGKSTLLKVLAGLLPVQCGAVQIFGLSPGPQTQRMVGYVPQSEAINWSFPVTVTDVVLMGTYAKLGFLHRPHQHERDAAAHAIEQVGMSAFADTQIGQLSGGQQQRVFVARALVEQPRLLLLDEPIAGVDATTQHAIFTLLEDLQQHGTTIVVTTHDLSCVAEWFDRVLCLNHRVIAYGKPESVLTRETLSATFGSHVLFGAAVAT
ncbi:MAG: metal ABC transporter ATP-binding protein [Candidatus Eremiobacteraeota bacterium]|nr:metal ABC transporter ATP-binding protein [Candidatus Eremiobacteraeota bacterium]